MKIMIDFRQALLLTIFLFLPMSSLAEGSKGHTPSMPKPKADVYIVEPPKNLAISLKYPAQVKAFEKVSVVARVSGILEKKYFTEGQVVTKGDLLYFIEDDIYLARVNVAKSSVQISLAALNKSTRSWKRIKKLVKNKFASEEASDTAFSTFEQASASLLLAKAQLKQAQIDLNYTQVTAPISGVIGLKNIDIGDFVSATNAGPATRLIDITQNNKVYVEFSMPLRDYAKIKNKFWTLPANHKIAVVLEIEHKITDRVGMVDFMDVNINKATSTVQMRAMVENPDGYLMPGGFVRILLKDIVQTGVITVPQKAILQNPMGTIVFVADHGKVTVKPVILGNEIGDKTIVTGGPLASGDKVIINNFFRLKPGAELQVDHIINAGSK